MQQGCSKLQHELKDHFETVELDTKKYIKDNMVASLHVLTRLKKYPLTHTTTNTYNHLFCTK